MALQFQEIRSGAFDILREVEGDSNAYPVSFVDDIINTNYFNSLTVGIENVFTGELVKKPRLPFNETSVYYTNANTTYLSADIASGDTTIPAITTGYPTSGSLYINGNIVEYTGVTGTSFTGVTGLRGNFVSGTEVSIAFELPANYSDVQEVRYNNNFSVPCKDYLKIFSELTDLNSNVGSTSIRPITEKFYVIIGGTHIVLFNLNITGEYVEVIYNKKPTLLVNDDDTIVIPDDQQGTFIKYIAIGEILYNRGEEVRAKEVFLYGLGKLKSFYAFYNNQSAGRISGTRISTGKNNYLNF